MLPIVLRSTVAIIRSFFRLELSLHSLLELLDKGSNVSLINVHVLKLRECFLIELGLFFVTKILSHLLLVLVAKCGGSNHQVKHL